MLVHSLSSKIGFKSCIKSTFRKICALCLYAVSTQIVPKLRNQCDLRWKLLINIHWKFYLKMMYIWTDECLYLCKSQEKCKWICNSQMNADKKLILLLIILVYCCKVRMTSNLNLPDVAPLSRGGMPRCTLMLLINARGKGRFSV